jgi:predicted transposase/invertase (TIGR01784 family)
MEELQYKFTHDVLFKMVFTRYQRLLKRLVAQLLGISLESIGQFQITNPEIQPENIGDKFCRLDINMAVDGQLIDLEVQVNDEKDYPERSLYYWAREYSSVLGEGEDYRDLPRTIVISIVAFSLFNWEEYHSEFQALEVMRHSPLTDKMALHYYELSKLPEVVRADDELLLWLRLFKAKTVEELQQIEALGVPVMAEAIEAFRHIAATKDYKEIERLRDRARHNEASALRHAAEVAEQAEREKWQGVVAKNEAALAGKDAALAEQKIELAEQAAEIAQLRKRLNED